MPILDPRHPCLTAAWKPFREQILARACHRCECVGECGLHKHAQLPRRCIERHKTPAVFATGVVFLTIAHECVCDPPCLLASHVRALCQRCHLRFDAKRHAATRKTRQEARLAIDDWT